MTFQEKFDELKKKYGKIDEKKLTDSFAIQINMTEDESHGTFYAAYVNGVFAVEPYDYRDHTAMITVPVAVLEDVLAGKADPVAKFLAGELAVEGNVDHALMLVELMKAPKKVRKPRAKKAESAAVKAEAAEAKAEKKAEKKTVKKAEKPADAAADAPKKKATRAKKSEK
ncbi:MAG: SCP2 sterol-binding domain-containing protein [Clostridia bacterium]|nr:SCP2 sterol-binding domain-containing protein [Clostridia bacterium]